MRTSRRSTVVLLTLGAFLLLSASASAGTLTEDGDTLVFTGGDNHNHEVEFERDDLGDVVIDTQPITSAPAGCGTVPSTSVACPGHTGLRVELGAGDDSVTTVQDCFVAYEINLGEGTNSKAFNSDCGIDATATVTAGSGEDTLHGGSAVTNVTIHGGGGRDTLNGGEGNDVIHGGDGDERALNGGPGNDQLFGEGGADLIKGGAGNDVEDGGPGDDNVEGTNGADVVDGGPGSDQIYGDIASCSAFCSFDADQLFARDGERDVVDCGGGADSAQVDELAVVAFCATVDRPNLTVVAPPPPKLPAARPLSVAKSVKVKGLLRKASPSGTGAQRPASSWRR